MTPANPETQFREILYRTVAETFFIPVESLSAATTAADVDGWDSMAQGVLIMTLEGELGFELPLGPVMGAANLGELLAVLVASKPFKPSTPSSS